MRQQGVDSDQKLFRDILDKIKDGGFNKDDMYMLNDRNFEKLSKDEQKIFEEESISLCSRNVDLIPFNIERTRAVGEPIAVIKSLNQAACIESR